MAAAFCAGGLLVVSITPSSPPAPATTPAATRPALVTSTSWTVTDAFGPWLFLESRTRDPNPDDYLPLPVYDAACCGPSPLPGALAWRESQAEGLLPRIAMNPTPFVHHPAPTVSWPPGTFLMHPSAGRLAVLGWRSPLSGSIAISGGVFDLDAECGDGIEWNLSLERTPLAHGSIANGGRQRFDEGGALDRIAVDVGTVLFLAIGPGKTHYCDSTGIDLTIRTR